jgi:hypothetical protein
MTDHDSSSKALVIPAPAVCLVRFAGDAASGAFMGSVFGYGEVFFFLIPLRLFDYKVIEFEVD